MTYNPNVPQPTDSPSTDSQPQFLINFQQLNTQFSVDHVALTAGADNGKHNQVTLIEQAGDPATAANEVALYSKVLGGASTLYLRKESSGTVIQLSAGTDPVIAGQGTSFLPGGVIIKWGTCTINIAATAITFAVPAFPNNCWSLSLSPGASVNSTQQVVFNGLATTGFTGYGSANNIFCYYIAIGN